MIRITVTGDTHPMRKLLNDMKFSWNGKTWQKIEGEAGINHLIESIRPPVSWSESPSPKITITLESVDVWGKKMHEGVLKFRLKAGERDGVDFFKTFLEEVSGVQVITTCAVRSNPAHAEEEMM